MGVNSVFHASFKFMGISDDTSEKSVQIAYLKCNQDESNWYLTFEITTNKIASKTAKVFVEQMNAKK